jgi:hypothetical protein
MLRMSDFGQRVRIAVLLNNHGAGSAAVQGVRRTPALSAIGARGVVAGASRKFQESGLRVAIGANGRGCNGLHSSLGGPRSQRSSIRHRRRHYHLDIAVCLMNWAYAALRVRHGGSRWRHWFWSLCLVVFHGAADDADDARTSYESGTFPSCRQHDERNHPAGDRFSDDRATRTRSLIHGLAFRCSGRTASFAQLGGVGAGGAGDGGAGGDPAGVAPPTQGSIAPVIADILPAIGAICGSQPALATGGTPIGAAARISDASPTASLMIGAFFRGTA